MRLWRWLIAIKSFLAIGSVDVELKTNVLEPGSASIDRDINRDDGNKVSLRNAGFYVNTDMADHPSGFYKTHKSAIKNLKIR